MINKPLRLSRRGPDRITEELVTVLGANTWFEFKPLFLIIRDNLRARNAARGDGEMLRLRAYEKLQNMVQQGSVEKTGKQYRGITAALATLAEHLATLHLQSAPRPVTVPAVKPAYFTIAG